MKHCSGGPECRVGIDKRKHFIEDLTWLLERRLQKGDGVTKITIPVKDGLVGKIATTFEDFPTRRKM